MTDARQRVRPPAATARPGTAGQDGSVKRIAIVGPDAGSLVRLRGGLIRHLVGQRHSVLAFAPSFDTGAQAELAKLGARTARLETAATARGWLSDHRATSDLGRQLDDWRPHVVLGFGGKPMLLAARAARRVTGARSVSLVTSLASLLPTDGAKLPLHARWQIKSALRTTDVLVCHNADSARRLEALALLRPDLDVRIVPGGGVDLHHYAETPLPPIAGPVTFLMIAALERSKGVLDFCAAARRLRDAASNARCVLVASPGGSAAPVAQAEINAGGGNAVELVTDVDDVRPWLAKAHVFVQPSHSEGMSRTLLEALAMARPVIATDIPGCREAVDERVNGILVAPGDVAALTAAMASMLRHPEQLPAMARAGRLKAERRFDQRQINRQLVAAMGLA